MSDLIRPSVARTARVEHRCISCGWLIACDELLDAFYVAAEMLREAQASADELLRVAWEWRSPPS